MIGQICILQIFSLNLWHYYYFLNGIFFWESIVKFVFNLWWGLNLFICSFTILVFCLWSRNTLHSLESQRNSLMFSPKIFKVLVFMFRLLMHLVLIFRYVVLYRSSYSMLLLKKRVCWKDKTQLNCNGPIVENQRTEWV